MHPGLLRILVISSNDEALWLHLRIDETFRDEPGWYIVDLTARKDRLTARGGRQTVNMLSALRNQYCKPEAQAVHVAVKINLI